MSHGTTGTAMVRARRLSLQGSMHRLVEQCGAEALCALQLSGLWSRAPAARPGRSLRARPRKASDLPLGD
jgi:hypothetical protein